MATMSERDRRIAGGPAGALVALGLLAATSAAAQTDLGPVLLSGEVEFGGRVVWGDENAAKFREYRDLRDGLFGGFDLLLEDQELSHWLRARGENPGYDDQRYWVEGGRYGRYTIDLFYGELPHVFSASARTPYVRQGKSRFALPLSVAERDALETAGSIAPGDLTFVPQDLDLLWREGRIGAEYHAGEAALLRASYRIQDKEGSRNFGIGFGNPGGTFISLPARVDEQIHEVRLGTDWTLGSSVVSAEYLGNFFDNALESVTGDNPLVSPATTTMDPDQGRSATLPDNWAQSLLLSGSSTLPVDMPNRISGSFAYGFRRQDENFLDHTINPRTTNPAPPPNPNSLDGKVQTLLGNIVATARPAPELGAKFRYRIYDYDNQTDSIRFPQHVQNDGALETNPRTSVHNDYLRQNADLDLSWDFAEGWTGVLGYAWEYWNRSSDREVEDLHEHGPTLKLDHRTLDGKLLHAGYEFRVRDGSRYDPFAPIEASFDLTCTGVPSLPGECSAVKFPELRKFDQANRYLHRFDLLGKIVAAEDLELSFTSNVGFADYHDTDFGLTESLEWSLGGDALYQLHRRVSLLGYYTYQWQEFEQHSRWRPRNFVPPIMVTDDPLNDWKSRTRYQYHNAEAIVRFALLPDRLDAEIGYLVQYGEEETNASGTPGGTTPGDAENYPNVEDLLQAVSATLAWQFTENVTLRTGYRYEDYDIDNFRDDNIPSLADGSPTDGRNIYLGDVIRDYTAHIFAMSAVLRF